MGFFAGFKDFAANDFYISGESYGGMYIPYTAKAVVDGNDLGNPKINLKGILIGNGRIVTDPAVVGGASDKYFLGRNFVDPATKYILEN